MRILLVICDDDWRLFCGDRLICRRRLQKGSSTWGRRSWRRSGETGQGLGSSRIGYSTTTSTTIWGTRIKVETWRGQRWEGRRFHTRGGAGPAGPPRIPVGIMLHLFLPFSSYLLCFSFILCSCVSCFLERENDGCGKPYSTRIEYFSRLCSYIYCTCAQFLYILRTIILVLGRHDTGQVLNFPF